MKEFIKVIAFDADDTLWSNEPFFQEIEKQYTVPKLLPSPWLRPLCKSVDKSDIQPVLSLGGYGVHIPFEVMWKHEVADTFTHTHLKQIERFDELLALFG